MKIKIKESQYTKLNEAVGVPTNIVEVAQQLYDKMMLELNHKKNLHSLLKKDIVLKELNSLVTIEKEITYFDFPLDILDNLEDENSYPIFFKLLRNK
jgi:hypothetical protein